MTQTYPLSRELVLGASLVMSVSAACVPGLPPADPTLLGRHAATKQLAFAYELAPACALEASNDPLPPADAPRWNKVGPNELANAQLAVVDRSTRADERGMARMLRVRDAAGKMRWLRNVPAQNAAELERRWSCALDAEALAGRVKAVSATSVRLVPSAPSCHSITPVIGDASDVTFDPYSVLGRRLVHTETGLAAVVTLASADGEHVLTLTATDLDACFAATKRAPVPSEEREKIATWLGDTSLPPPSAALPTYLQTAGLDETACLSEGSGSTRHDECRGAPFGVTSGARGALGLPALRFFRERVTDAVHAYGGKIAPSEELAGINVQVRQVRGPGDAAGAFTKALQATVVDVPRQKVRWQHGYRLLRAADTSNGTTANATLDIDVTYALPKLETTTHDRQQKKVRGKKSGPSPAFAAITRRIDAARRAAAGAQGDVAAYTALYGAPLPRCEGALPIACDVTARTDVGAVRAAKRDSRISALESAAKTVPALAEQDDAVLVDYRAKVYRRQGEATVTLKLTPTDALPGIPPVHVTRKVRFDATEMDVAGDAAKGIVAKAGRPPEQPQVDAAVAAAVLPEIDRMLAVWMWRATGAAAPAAFEPGSRAQLAVLARWVASNRVVKLTSDLTEDRTEMLASGHPVEYPIAIPEGQGRCWSFVAIAARPSVDVNLALRSKDTGALVARDARAAMDAGFDVCPPPGSYRLELSTAAAAAAGTAAGPIAVGMFESTPGVTADADYGAAIPPAMRSRGAAISAPPGSPRLK